MTYDYDWLVVGSGFGGSVSALRLAEKGYSVAVLECGSRFRDEDFAESTLREPRRYFWMPKLGMRGVLRISFFKDVLVVSGSGVGGGSLGYANTLYRARSAFFEDPQWAELGNWELELAPHYDTAERMLGVTEYEGIGPADKLLREYGEEIGVGETFTNTRVGVFFDQPGKEVPDPYFEGEGPDRTGCMRCGSCMVGCRHGAKNTLVKNYLWFAEKLGVKVFPERQVTSIRPLGAADGSDGYAVTAERSGSWLHRGRQTLRAKGVVVAAGALGTNHLLANCKHERRAAAALRPDRRRRPHQLGVDPGGHRPRRRARLQPLGRDHLQHLPRPRHPHRGRHLWPGRRRDERHLHHDDRGGDETDPAAEVAGGDGAQSRCRHCAGRSPTSGRSGR